MADKIVIEGVRRYDGEYDLDLVGEPLTTLEWRWIKKLSGYLPLTVAAGWVGGDPDLFLALAVVAMRRAGKIEKEDALMVAERMEDGATIRVVGDAEEVEEVEEADPPVAPTEPRSSDDSGVLSSPTSGPPGQPPSPTGSPDSPRSATSDPLTLVI